MTIHHGVAMLAYTIFRRHLVVGDAFLGENGPNPHILTILIGWVSLFDNIRTEAGPLVYSKNPSYTAHHAAHDSTDDRAHRPSRPFTISGAPLHSAGDSLGLAYSRKKDRGCNGRRSDKIADHDNSIDLGIS